MWFSEVKTPITGKMRNLTGLISEDLILQRLRKHLLLCIHLHLLLFPMQVSDEIGPIGRGVLALQKLDTDTLDEHYLKLGIEPYVRFIDVFEHIFEILMEQPGADAIQFLRYRPVAHPAERIKAGHAPAMIPAKGAVGKQIDKF